MNIGNGVAIKKDCMEDIANARNPSTCVISAAYATWGYVPLADEWYVIQRELIGNCCRPKRKRQSFEYSKNI